MSSFQLSTSTLNRIKNLGANYTPTDESLIQASQSDVTISFAPYNKTANINKISNFLTNRTYHKQIKKSNDNNTINNFSYSYDIDESEFTMVKGAYNIIDNISAQQKKKKNLCTI